MSSLARWRQRVEIVRDGAGEIADFLWRVARCRFHGHVWSVGGDTDPDGWFDSHFLFDGTAHGPYVTGQSRVCDRCWRREHRHAVPDE